MVQSEVLISHVHTVQLAISFPQASVAAFVQMGIAG